MLYIRTQNECGYKLNEGFSTMGGFMNFIGRQTKEKHDKGVLPRHIGIIMDGNGRWAQKRGLPRTAGHYAGADTFKKIVLYCEDIGIEYLTAYAFSTENWKRPREEVSAIISLLKEYIVGTREKLGKENVRLKFIGDMTPFPKDIQDDIIDIEKRSMKNTAINVNIAFNYGARAEIVYAMRRIAEDIEKGRLSLADITEQAVSDRIYTANQPDVDLIIRPSGELRLSNFMLWQAAYSELWFSNVLWPDFKPKHLDEAIAHFQKRDRRFGAVK